MHDLGMKSEVLGAERLRPVTVIGRPTSMPPLLEGQKIICGYNQGLGERLIVCDSLEDMQQIWDAYRQGAALRIAWYRGDDPGFFLVV